MTDDNEQISYDQVRDLTDNFHPRKLGFEQSESSENIWIREDSSFYFLDTGNTWRLQKVIEGNTKPKKELLKSSINEQMIKTLLNIMDYEITD